MTDPTTEEILALALDHASRGWHVFPCAPDKRPRTPNGKDDATTDPEKIRRWSWTDSLIGVYCERSGFFALDIDNHPEKGADGKGTWDELTRTHGGGIVAGPAQTTPSRGAHILFKLPGFRVPNNAGKLAPGLDLRSNGYICTGPGYRWIHDHGPDKPILDAPDWLLGMIQAMSSKPAPAPRTQAGSPSSDAGEFWLGYYLRQASQGTRNETGFRLACQLRDAGLTEAEAAGIMTDYAHQVPGEGYTEREALASLSQAYKVPRRDPARSLTGIRANSNGSTPPEEPPDELPPAGADEQPQPKDRRKDPLGAEYVAFLADQGYAFKLCALDDSLWVNDERMNDPLAAEIRTRLRDHGFTKVHVAEDAYLAHARNNSFNPVTDFLNSLTWDGQDHITALAGYITDKHGVFALELRKWLIGAVARPITGGKQNRVLVLEGTQGVGKSFFARWIGSPLERRFSEAMPNPDDKDSHLALATTWIWEIKELGSVTRRADRESLKAWLTLESVQARPPYGRHEIIKPAITSFIATVNDEGGFFTDPTGSRRYMTASIQAINWSYAQEIDPHQVWAQAVALYRQGEDWNLTPEEAQKISAINDEYAFALPIHDWLDRYTEDCPGAFTEFDQIRQAITSTSDLRIDSHTSREIAGWMRKNGYEPARQYVKVELTDASGIIRTEQKRVRGFTGVKVNRRPSFGQES